MNNLKVTHSTGEISPRDTFNSESLKLKNNDIITIKKEDIMCKDTLKTKDGKELNVNGLDSVKDAEVIEAMLKGEYDLGKMVSKCQLIKQKRTLKKAVKQYFKDVRARNLKRHQKLSLTILVKDKYMGMIQVHAKTFLKWVQTDEVTLELPIYKDGNRLAYKKAADYLEALNVYKEYIKFDIELQDNLSTKHIKQLGPLTKIYVVSETAYTTKVKATGEKRVARNQYK